MKVDLLVVDDALEAIAIRGMLESVGVEVRCHFLGTVKQLISRLNGGESLSEIVIISCHGNKQGMVLPALDVELEKEMPYCRVLKAEEWAQFLKLKGQLIINTGCCLGNESIAKSFLQNGALAYIGLKTYVDGSTTTFFIISFLYFYMCKKLSLSDAFKKAQSLDEPDLFGLYQ